jgi:preprotein translocase subunit SecF
MNARDARSRKSLISFGVAALLAVGAATAQVATAGSTGIDATGSYQSEVQACMSGRTQQDRDTCLKEARNAQADKQRGVLDTQGSLEANATQRCNVFTTGEDKAACQARTMGMGSADGSVAGGGVIREVETVVLPAGQSSVTIQPQTSDPVVLVPSPGISR